MVEGKDQGDMQITTFELPTTLLAPGLPVSQPLKHPYLLDAVIGSVPNPI